MNGTDGLPLVARQPHYVLVAQALISDIQRGRYQVGSFLPPELDLCRHFGVSRHTMREAIRLLQERGLVTRQRGVGTEVRANRPEESYVQSSTSIADLPQYVKDTRLVTHASEDVHADEALAALLECPVGQRWVHVSGFRFAGKAKLPIALTDIYVNAAYSGVQKLIGAQRAPVYQLIERQYGESIVEVRQTIRATIIGAAEARELQVRRGTAGLLVTRHYIGKNGRLIEVSVNLHPADRFAYSMSLHLRVPARA